MIGTREPLAADRTPEERGLARDQVRLLVAQGGVLTHSRFDRLTEHLAPGDLVVVNRSATRGGAWDGVTDDGRELGVHLATQVAGRRWVVELRHPDGQGPVWDAEEGSTVHFGVGGRLRLVRPSAPSPRGVRLWEAAVQVPADIGRPIIYDHLATRPGLDSFQTIFGTVPGSAEMASAGRPFSHDLVTRLVGAGITVAPVTLHAGVSSPEVGERPQTEWFDVPTSTAALVEHTRRSGGRIVAVGTTVTRALESAVVMGHVRSASGWTARIVTSSEPPVVVDGLITGWHESGASHLDLLAAVAGREVVDAAMLEALDAGYLWHEFGDSALFLPG